MVSAVADSQMAVEAMEAEAYDYVTKPFKLDDLTWRVRNALERQKLALKHQEYLSNLEERIREESERLRGQFVSLVHDLAREYALGQAGKSSRPSNRKEIPYAEPSRGLYTPVASVEEFAEALLQAIDGNGHHVAEDAMEREGTDASRRAWLMD